MKFMILALFSFSLHAQSVFTPVTRMDAPAGIVYDVKQVPVTNRSEFSGKKVAILAAHGVQESELTYPYEYLKARGAKVDILIPSWSEGKVLGVSYLKPTLWIKGTATFTQGLNQDYDLIILTGGSWNSNVVRKDADALKLISEQNRKGGLIAAICSGSQILIDAKLARNTRLTGTESIAIDLKNAGSIYLAQPAVVDRNIITGRGPVEVKEFMLAIHEELK